MRGKRQKRLGDSILRKAIRQAVIRIAGLRMGSWYQDARIACPVGGVESGAHVAMKAGIRPIPDAPNQAMLERVYVHIIDMPMKVGFVANEMFPITTLPYATLAPFHAYSRAIFICRQGATEQRLDQPPTQRIVRIARRERP